MNIELNSYDVCLHLYSTLVRTLALDSFLCLFQIFWYSVKLTSVKTFLVSCIFFASFFIFIAFQKGPEKFQETDRRYDIILTVEEKVYDQVRSIVILS
jgi:hypothetical protein